VRLGIVVSTLLFILLISWAALFVSSKAVLIRGEKIEKSRPGDQAHLSCWYFTGTGTFERTFWHDPNGAWGRAACPRLVNL
jgi:hypothetical protein